VADGSRFIVIDIGQKGLEGSTRAETECKASNDLSVTIRWGWFSLPQIYSREQNPCRKLLKVNTSINLPFDRE